jgi:hypothetical protein
MREARQRTIERNRNTYAAAPVRDALEAQAIRALREAEQAKQEAARQQTSGPAAQNG